MTHRLEGQNKVERIRERRRQRSQEHSLAAAKILSGLPKQIDPITFASFRSQEIKAIEQELVDAVKDRKRRLFQTLPRYLRRRTASYNSKRVPRPYRAQAAAEFEGRAQIATDPPKKSHKGPKNKPKWHIQKEYASRQRATKPKWLETHIWHAKRMHMVGKWGFKIAQRSNQKVFRYNYEQGRNGCCIYDYSYLRLYSIDDLERMKMFIAKHCHSLNSFVESEEYFTGHLYFDANELDGFISEITIVKNQDGWLIAIHPSSITEFNQIALKYSLVGPLKMNIFCLFGKKTDQIIEQVQLQYTETAFSLYKLPSPFHLTSQYCWIISKQGKGRELWRKFIYANAKPYSLADLNNFYFENEAFTFPFVNCQSESFKREMEQIAEQLSNKWNAKPPAKRVNYTKLGIDLPFQLPLVDDSSMLQLCYIESVSSGVPSFNARIYSDLESNCLIGCVVYGSYSLRTGKGKAIALLKSDIPSNFWCRNIDSPIEHSFECQRMDNLVCK